MALAKERKSEPIRGNIRRLSPKEAHSSKVNIIEEQQALTKWSRRQDYHSYYNKLIDWELEDELKQYHIYIKKHDDGRIMIESNLNDTSIPFTPLSICCIAGL